MVKTPKSPFRKIPERATFKDYTNNYHILLLHVWIKSEFIHKNCYRAFYISHKYTVTVAPKKEKISRVILDYSSDFIIVIGDLHDHKNVLTWNIYCHLNLDNSCCFHCTTGKREIIIVLRGNCGLT